MVNPHLVERWKCRKQKWGCRSKCKSKGEGDGGFWSHFLSLATVISFNMRAIFLFNIYSFEQIRENHYIIKFFWLLMILIFLWLNKLWISNIFKCIWIKELTIMIQSKNVFVLEVVWKNNQRSASSLQDTLPCPMKQGRVECEKFPLFSCSAQTCFNQMPLNIAQNLLAVKNSIEFFKWLYQMARPSLMQSF
jgi:hypothetical protein